jgi:hypothetical protein
MRAVEEHLKSAFEYLTLLPHHRRGWGLRTWCPNLARRGVRGSWPLVALLCHCCAAESHAILRVPGALLEVKRRLAVSSCGLSSTGDDHGVQTSFIGEREDL